MSGAKEISGYAVGWGGRAGRLALDLLFPPLCVACGARVGGAHSLCAICWRYIAFLEGACCERCGLPFEVDPGEGTLCAGCHAKPHDFTRARSLFAYDEAVLCSKCT